MRYDGMRKIPEGYSQREREEVEETIKEFEHQFAFVEEFGKGALKVWKRINEKRGHQKGRYLIEKYGIEGADINTVQKIIEAYMDDDPGRTARPEIWREGDKLIIESRGFCPLLESARILKIDMAHTCPYSTRPYFHAMCKAVNPNVRHKNTAWRAQDDEVCQEMFWIEE